MSCAAVAVPKKDGEPVAGPSLEGSGKFGGFSPADLRSAYALPSGGGEGRTVAITIAFDDPNAESDLAVYRETYGLASCTTANGCFKKVNQKGETKNYPEGESGWAFETSLDLDMVSATCPDCHILLVEADSNTFEDMAAAVEKAAEMGASVISDSWGAPEFSGETSLNSSFHHPGIPVLFSSGDFGYGVEYPAASPDVIAVGGTSLKKAEGARGWSETVWGGAGSGCSEYEEKPAWEKDSGCAKRTVADVSAVADPFTPVSVYDTYGYLGWEYSGGTSVAAPLVAGVEAISSSAFRAAGPSAFSAVGRGQALFDVADGENGSCGSYLCQGEKGYDGPTGWGTPDGALDLPVAITDPPTIVSTSKATLHGAVDPGGLETKYRFEYGTTTGYGTSVPIPDQSVGSGSAYVDVSQTIEGLKAQTSYHYRISATNSKGTFPGHDRTFGTTPPTATTKAASEVHANDARLKATVNPEGGETAYYFEYGPTAAYGRKVPSRPSGSAKPSMIGSGTSNVEVSALIGALAPNKTYHFRVVAENIAGTVYGKDESLTTGPSQWKNQAVPHPGEKSTLRDVSCVSQSFCMAIGIPYWAEYVFSELWNGKEWSLVSVPTPTFEDVFLESVSCSSPTSCVAVGTYIQEENLTPFAEHWDGAAWTFHPVPMPQNEMWGNLRDVSCSSSSSCVAVGSYITLNADSTERVHLLAERWDGSEWIRENLEPPNTIFGQLSSVSCVSASYCMAVGYYSTTGEWHALAKLWNGSEWSVVQDVGPKENAPYVNLGSVSCAAADACMVLAGFGGSSVTPERWDGKGWTLESLPEPIGVRSGVSVSLSCPAVNSCTTVGWGATPGYRTVPLVFAWDGSKWSTQSTAEPTQEEEGTLIAGAALQGVSCVSPSWCITAGYYVKQTTKEFEDMIQTFRAPGPGAVTGSANGIRTTAATVHGTVNPGGLKTTYQLEYGETKVYGGKAPASAKEIGSGTEDVAVGEAIAGLKPETTYHFRVVATNSAGTTFGEDRRFTTRPLAPSFSSSFGKYGSGEGQLNEPLGIAIDSHDNVWIADTENNRVEKFDPSGKVLVQFGSEGAGAGQFKSPYDIAVDAKGNVWVADTFNSRIEKFNEKGEYLSQFGTQGSGAGQVDRPYGITVDAAGNLWVADTYNTRVEKFNEKGEYLSKFATLGGSPVDVAVDPENNVWIVEYAFNRIKKFSATGELLLTLGSKGSGAGQFNFPTGLTIDSSGDVWVGDSENNRIEVLNSKGEYLAQFGEVGAGNGQFSFPREVAFDSEGNVWVADSYNNRVQKWAYGPSALTEAASQVSWRAGVLNATVNPQGLETTYQFEYGKTTSYGSDLPASPKAIGAGEDDVVLNQTLRGLEPETTYHFRVVATNSKGTARGADRTFTTRSRVPVFHSSFGSQGSGPGQFSDPEGIAIDAAGNLWVVDSINSRVEKFNSKGEYLTQFGSEGSKAGQLRFPCGIAVDPEGNLWVADTGNGRVEKFNSKGEYLAEVGKFGTGKGQFIEPVAIAIEQSTGNAYISDGINRRVEKFNSKGEYLTQFGSQGSGNGQFQSPSGIAIDSATGDLYVTDRENGRVEKFNSKGEYLTQFGSQGSGNGQFQSPTGIATESGGMLWVVDQLNNRVQKFNSKGEYLTQFGSNGSDDGEFSTPTNIAVDAQGNVWVVDPVNAEVQKWFYGGSPVVATETPTGIKTVEATLHAAISPEGSATSYQFEYGTTTSYGSALPASAQSIGSGIAAVKVSEALSGLSQGTTYHYRAVATNEAGTTYGADQALTTLKLPKATTEAATSIKATGATVNATVNPEGVATTYQFEYGTTTSYGTKAPASPKSAGSGTSNVSVSEAISGLSPSTTYHYRVVASSEAGTTYGADKTLMTQKPPAATTEAATSVTASGATLKGVVNPEGVATTYQFEYGTTTSYGTKAPASPKSAGSGTSNVSVSEAISGLSQGTTYHYRVVATNEAGTTNGADKTLTTLKLPKVTTEAATVVKANEATLSGTVNPEGSSTLYVFEYGTTTSYGSSTELKLAGSGTSDVKISEALSGLSQGVTYHYRLVAVSAAGLVNGADKTLTIKSPSATAEAATGVNSSEAVLNATVNPEGVATTYQFEYGTTTSYGTKAPASPKSIGSGTSGVKVSEAIAGLSPSTTYHYRVVATSAAGTTNGADKTLTTLALKPPAATTEAATSVTASGATLKAVVNPEGAATTYQFEYGTTTSYGTKVPLSPKSAGSGTSNVSVSEAVSGLSQNTTYHYRVVATNAAGTTNGADKTLTTLKLPKVTTEAASGVKSTEATLNGTINPEGSVALYLFEYGTTTSYGSSTELKFAESGTTDVKVSQALAGLAKNTTYHYRLYAAGAGGEAKGGDMSFTTSP